MKTSNLLVVSDPVLCHYVCLYALIHSVRREIRGVQNQTADLMLKALGLGGTFSNNYLLRSCHRWAGVLVPSVAGCLWWRRCGHWGRCCEGGSSAAPRGLQTAGWCSWWYLRLDKQHTSSHHMRPLTAGNNTSFVIALDVLDAIVLGRYMIMLGIGNIWPRWYIVMRKIILHLKSKPCSLTKLFLNDEWCFSP